jgi:transposase
LKDLGVTQPRRAALKGGVKIKNFQAVYPFESYVIDTVNCHAVGIQIKLRRDGRCSLRCPDCNTQMGFNRQREITAYDLSCGGGPVVKIHYPSIQGYCSCCASYKTIRPKEMHPTRRATWRLMRYVSLLARFVPMSAMTALVEVPPATAWRYDLDVLKADLPEPDLDGIEALLIDEKAVRRGHGYVTLVLNADTGELLHLDEGKKKASLESFFERLNEAQKATIKAVCIDRNGAYRAVIDEELPDAKIVFDKFHLLQNLGKVVDEVRCDENRKASAADLPLFIGQRFNLLRHPENLTEKNSSCLDKLLAANETLNTVYVLKDQFRMVWTYQKPGWARRQMKGWIKMVRDSAIKPLMRFAKGIERDIEQIVSWCTYPITNGRIEGFNSIISRVLFKTRGVRSIDYLFLKLRQESLLHG